MKVERFEDLNVWQLSRELVVEIYEVTSNDNFKKDCGLSSQIQRASVSVLSNIAEGFEKGYNKEFIRLLIASIIIYNLNILLDYCLIIQYTKPDEARAI